MGGGRSQGVREGRERGREGKGRNLLYSRDKANHKDCVMTFDKKRGKGIKGQRIMLATFQFFFGLWFSLFVLFTARFCLRIILW